MADEVTRTPRKSRRTPDEASIDPAAQEMLACADLMGIGTAFSRADDLKPCNIGAVGMCCAIWTSVP